MKALLLPRVHQCHAAWRCRAVATPFVGGRPHHSRRLPRLSVAAPAAEAPTQELPLFRSMQQQDELARLEEQRERERQALAVEEQAEQRELEEEAGPQENGARAEEQRSEDEGDDGEADGLSRFLAQRLQEREEEDEDEEQEAGASRVQQQTEEQDEEPDEEEEQDGPGASLSLAYAPSSLPSTTGPTDLLAPDDDEELSVTPSASMEELIRVYCEEGEREFLRLVDNTNVWEATIVCLSAVRRRGEGTGLTACRALVECCQFATLDDLGAGGLISQLQDSFQYARPGGELGTLERSIMMATITHMVRAVPLDGSEKDPATMGPLYQAIGRAAGPGSAPLDPSSYFDGPEVRMMLQAQADMQQQMRALQMKVAGMESVLQLLGSGAGAGGAGDAEANGGISARSKVVARLTGMLGRDAEEEEDRARAEDKRVREEQAREERAAAAQATEVERARDRRARVGALARIDGARPHIPVEALIEAVDADDREELSRMLEANADEVNKSDEDLQTPLHHAASLGHVGCVAVLLSHGADPDIADKNGDTPLHVAFCARSSSSAVTCVSLLLGCKANPNSRNQGGWAPLHNAAMVGEEHGMTKLLRNGADVNAANNVGDTPLHIAARFSSREIAAVLLASGANEAAVNQAGKTPREVALTEREA